MERSRRRKWLSALHGARSPEAVAHVTWWADRRVHGWGGAEVEAASLRSRQLVRDQKGDEDSVGLGLGAVPGRGTPREKQGPGHLRGGQRGQDVGEEGGGRGCPRRA